MRPLNGWKSPRICAGDATYRPQTNALLLNWERRWHAGNMSDSRPDNELRGISFEGGRFDQGGLPTDALVEIAVYNDILVEVSKAIFLRDNPDLDRVPGGFSDKLRLLLTDIRGGSVAPVLQGGSTPDSEQDIDVRLAADHVAEAIYAASRDQPLPEIPGFDPRRLCKLGRSLRPDEQITFRGRLNRQSVLNSEVREKLKGLEEEFRRENRRAVGQITRVNATRSTFTFREAETGRSYSGRYEEHEHLPILRHSITDKWHEGPYVAIEGEFAQPLTPRKRSKLYLDSISPTDLEYEHRFDASQDKLHEFMHMDDSWFDDFSKRPSDNAIQSGQRVMHALRASLLPSPKVFPTPEGGISLEWKHSDLRIGVVIYSSGTTGQYFSWNKTTDEDNVEDDREISPKLVVSFIGHLIGN